MIMLNKVKSKVNWDLDLKEIFKGSSVAFVLRIAGVIAGYGFAFLVSRWYGSHGMGIYSLSLSILTFVGLFGTLGIGTSILRFSGQFIAEDCPSKIRSVYLQGLSLTLPLGILLAILLYQVSGYIAIHIFQDESLELPLQIISVSLPFFVLNSINLELIRSFKKIRISESLRNLSRPGISFLFLLLAHMIIVNINLPIYGLAIGIVATCFISYFYVHWKLGKFPKTTQQGISKSHLFKTSFPMMLSAFSFIILGNIDTLMLGKFSTIQNVGIYNIALKIALVNSFVLVSVNTIVAPKISEFFWAGREKDFKKSIKFSSRLIFYFSLPILLAILFFPEFLMGVFGEEFIIGKSALVLITIGQFVNAASGSVGNIMNMTGREKPFRNILVMASILSVLLNFLLIPMYGINGAAVANMVSVIFWNLTAVIYTKVKIGINSFYLPLISK